MELEGGSDEPIAEANGGRVGSDTAKEASDLGHRTSVSLDVELGINSFEASAEDHDELGGLDGPLWFCSGISLSSEASLTPRSATHLKPRSPAL